MSTLNYGFDNAKVQKSPLTAEEVNFLFELIDSQLNGAVSLLGAGVLPIFLEDGTEDASYPAFRAVIDGNAVEMEGGFAVSRETVHPYNWVYMKRSSDRRFAGEFFEGANFLYLVPRFAANGGVLDSRTGADALFDIRQEESEDAGDGALLLATVQVAGGAPVPGTLVDRRPFAFVYRLGKRVGQLESDVDYDDTARGFGSVSARLSLLEGRTTGEVDPDVDLSGYVLKAEFNALKTAFALLSQQVADFIANQNASNVVGVTQTSTVQTINTAHILARVTHLDPLAAREFVAGIDMPDMTGNSQRLHQTTATQVRVGGNAVYDEEAGNIHA